MALWLSNKVKSFEHFFAVYWIQSIDFLLNITHTMKCKTKNAIYFFGWLVCCQKYHAMSELKSCSENWILCMCTSYTFHIIMRFLIAYFLSYILSFSVWIIMKLPVFPQLHRGIWLLIPEKCFASCLLLKYIEYILLVIVVTF